MAGGLFVEHLMHYGANPKEGLRDERYVYATYFEQSPPFEDDLEADPMQLVNLAILDTEEPSIGRAAEPTLRNTCNSLLIISDGVTTGARSPIVSSSPRNHNRHRDPGSMEPFKGAVVEYADSTRDAQRVCTDPSNLLPRYAEPLSLPI